MSEARYCVVPFRTNRRPELNLAIRPRKDKRRAKR